VETKEITHTIDDYHFIWNNDVSKIALKSENKCEFINLIIIPGISDQFSRETWRQFPENSRENENGNSRERKPMHN
jgi:hypothetical protein